MTDALQNIDQLINKLQGLLPMQAEQQQQLDRKIRLEFNYNSNHMEGNTLTYGETQLLLLFGKTTGNHELREYEEMKAHDVAFDLVQQWAADAATPLTEMAIKNLHQVLLVNPFWKEAQTPDGHPTRRLINIGSYKEQPNSVLLQSGELFPYTSPQDTPIEMGELIAWYREQEEAGTIHPLALAAMLHYRFVRIHPFDDGNGRMARLLMNYILLQHGLPPVIIKSAEKKDYLFALNQADTGDMDAFIIYIARQLEWSLELYIKAANGEDIGEEDDWKKRLKIIESKTSKESALKLTKSAKTLSDLGDVFLVPLIGSMLQDFARIKALFVGGNIFAATDGTSKDIENATMVASLFQPDSAEYTLSVFEFRYILQGYKHAGTNTFSIATGIKCAFETYRFGMWEDYGGGSTKESWHLYEENIAIQIDNIVRHCGESLMNQIEANLK